MAETTLITLHTEQVNFGEFANWPYDNSANPLYNQIMNEIKTTKVNRKLVFYGWRYNNIIYREPLPLVDNNPFGPIENNANIEALWANVSVFCWADINHVGYEGGNVTIKFYAMVGNEFINDISKVLLFKENQSISCTQPQKNEPIVYNFNIERNGTNSQKTYEFKSSYMVMASGPIPIYSDIIQITQDAYVEPPQVNYILHANVNKKILDYNEQENVVISAWITESDKEEKQQISDNYITITPYNVQGSEPITYETYNPSISNNEATFTFINIDQNSDNEVKKLRFIIQSNTQEYGNLGQIIIDIEQVSNGQIIIPDIDYFIFNYTWEDENNGGGKDLDSLTVISIEDKNGDIRNEDFTNIPLGFRKSVFDDDNTNTKFSIYHNNLPLMKWGGDNMLSGAEGAIICLSNIVKTGKISNDDIIKIKIYANWYLIKSGGNMSINCKGYKRIEGEPKYSEDIDESESYVFKPTQNVNTIWDNYTSQKIVNSYGSINPYFENDFVPKLDKIYSHVMTVSYDVKNQIKTIQQGDSQNTGRIIRYDDIRLYIGDTYYGGNNSCVYTPKLSNQGGNQVFDEIYVKYYDDYYYLFSDDRDIIKITVNDNANGDKSIKIIKKADLGNTFNILYLSNLVITKNQDDTIKINFEIDENNTIEERKIEFNFLKYDEEGEIPVIGLAKCNTAFEIIQEATTT